MIRVRERARVGGPALKNICRACIDWRSHFRGNMLKNLKQYLLLPVLCATVALAHAQAASDVPASADAASAARQQDKTADRALRKDVIRSLTRTKGLNTARITVRVKNGVVMLQGSVADQSEIDLATRAASNTPGVASVKNSLTIQGPMGSE
jgi:hypothetical protein